MKIVEKFPYHTNGKMNWKEILDGKCREFIKDEDFTCTTHGFASQAHMAAKRHGCKVRAAVRGNSVFIQRKDVN